MASVKIVKISFVQVHQRMKFWLHAVRVAILCKQCSVCVPTKRKYIHSVEIQLPGDVRPVKNRELATVPTTIGSMRDQLGAHITPRAIATNKSGYSTIEIKYHRVHNTVVWKDRRLTCLLSLALELRHLPLPSRLPSLPAKCSILAYTSTWRIKAWSSGSLCCQPAQRPLPTRS